MSSISAKDKKKPSDDGIVIEEMKLGLWNMKVAHSSATWSFLPLLGNIRSVYPMFKQLFQEIYDVSPRMFTFYLFCQVWAALEDAILMHLSNSLLYKVEQGLITGNPDTYGIVTFILLRLMCSTFAAFLSWHGSTNIMLLKSRVLAYFNIRIMNAKLRVDLPTSQEHANTSGGDANDAWNSLETILGFFTEILTAGSQLALIIHVSRNSGGPIFTLLCISKPVFHMLWQRDIWDYVCFGFVNNKHYIRLRSLESFASGDFREDVICNNLRQWIIKEYQKAQEALGDCNDAPPYDLFSLRDSPVFDMFIRAIDDLPMTFCALSVVFRPSKFSLVSITVLQSSSRTLRYSLESIFNTSDRFRRCVKQVRKIYDVPKVLNILREGTTPYPPPSERPGVDHGSEGMGFELKNVSFSYPGSQKSASALRNISLTIKPGQLVVVVGSNGSGKSTMVRMLSRLYDPTSGEILIDGHLSKDYRMEDLHTATTVLSQDNKIYPLSLAENIGLGFPSHSSDLDMIKESAETGGALGFIEKLQCGLQTTLQSHVETFEVNLWGNNTHPLYSDLQNVTKTINISGGEIQRVVAARCFMRFKSDKVKFVAVDEPSSALDAEGELQLFNRLLDVRAGKTMVFVTHRFGHLTKHADLIICMKDGSIAESGTHEMLMVKDGEYAKLYNIQASAFSHKNDANLSVA